jgi:eukaryotic-like serine/threonine-protein kinase
MSIGIPFGRYRLTRRLARGGMAEVFLAAQQGPGGFARTVAVKRILPHLADTPQFLDMFMDEARLAAQLSHPNIAHIYEFGNVDDSYFIAMEYIDGVDLSVVVLDGLSKPLPLEHASRITADLCAALHYAHHCKGQDGAPLGIVHRDISPQNVLVSFDGTVKVVDFGIAKAAHHIERTKPGVVRGKYTYMSPEQVLGKSLDGRSDLFSAGIVLYELCTASSLFPRANAVQAMQLIRKAEIPKPKRDGSSLPGKLSRIIKRSLAKRREDRYQTAAEMQMDLEEYLRSAKIVNSIVLGDYFKEHYQKPQPEPMAAQSSPAGTVAAKPAGTARAVAPAGTALVDGTVQINASGPAPHDTDEVLDEVEDLASQATNILRSSSFDEQVFDSDDLDEAELNGPTNLIAPPPQASGIIYSQTTAPKMQIPSGLVTDSQYGHGSVDLTGTVRISPDELEEEEETREIGLEPAEVEHPTLDRSTSIRTGTARTDTLPDSAAFRAPAMASATISVRSFGRRLLVIGLIAAVAVTGLLVGLWISDPGDAPVAARAHSPREIEVLVAEPGSGRGPDARRQVRANAGAPATPEARLSISSNPSGASISLDGKLISGLTPLDHRLNPGDYKIEASFQGYEPQAQRVELQQGQTLKINFVLRPQAASHKVVLIKRPGASKRSRAAIRHARAARARRAAKRRLTKVQPQRGSTSPRPKPQGHGYLKITTLPWSKVYLGSRLLGITPLANVKVPAGRHRLRFVPERLPPLHRMVVVQPNKVTKLRLTLR